MGIGKRIKEAREKNNLTQTELGNLIGVTGSAVTNYENETSHPKEQVLYRLIEVLKVDANFLFQDVVSNNKGNILSMKEIQIVEKIRLLDSHGKKVIDALIDEELVRVEFEKQNMIPFKYSIQEYDLPVSAGTGQYLDYTCCTIAELDYEPPRGAEFIVKVSGDSMEPTYFDGDRLFVSTKAELFYGDIGIFNVDGNAYVKEYGKEGLISHNKKYSLIQSKNVKCIGKVLGKVKE